jgi:hypothetical protein
MWRDKRIQAGIDEFYKRMAIEEPGEEPGEEPIEESEEVPLPNQQVGKILTDMMSLINEARPLIDKTNLSEAQRQGLDRNFNEIFAILVGMYRLDY